MYGPIKLDDQTSVVVSVDKQSLVSENVKLTSMQQQLQQ
jgi:hypothetical protein